jgi:hypothetical protein
VTISGSDTGGSGLPSEPYSFDNGQNRQSSNTGAYNTNQNGLIVAIRDKAGNVTTGSVTFDNIDSTLPIGSIVINAGADYTTGIEVTLTLSADDLNTITEMCISNIQTCDARIPYATSTGRTLDSVNGVKTVYARFKDKAGNVSIPYSDSITLDSAAPTVTITANPLTSPTS